MIEKYGVDNPGKSKEVMKKAEETNMKRYGVKHAFQSEKVKEKINKTNIERYGTKTPRWHNESSRIQAETTNLERYGHINPFGGEEIKDKIVESNMKKYGVPWTTQSEEVKAKMRASYIKNYGVNNPAQASEVQEKMKRTTLERYGVESFMSSTIGAEKFRQAIFNKYGVYNPSHIGIKNYSDYLTLKDFIKNNPNMSLNDLSDNFNLPRIRMRIKVKEFGLEDMFKDFYTTSIREELFSDFLKNDEILSDLTVERNNRKILKGKELDFYFPSEMLAVEISPTYTHNSKVGWGNIGTGVNSVYHRNKFLDCAEQGIELITIFDWHNWDKVMEMIKSKLQGANSKIYGRNTSYGENVLTKDLFEKLSSWHILSLPSNLKRALTTSTLKHNGEIVGIALWGEEKDSSVELKRLVFKPGVNIPGGASKLIKNYIRERENLISVYTFSDCDLGTGSVYGKIGFKLTEQSRPTLNYYNIKQEKHVKHYSLVRQGPDRLLANFPDYKHVGKGDNLPNNKEIIESYGFLPVYDCGYRKWVLTI